MAEKDTNQATTPVTHKSNIRCIVASQRKKSGCSKYCKNIIMSAERCICMVLCLGNGYTLLAYSS